MELRYLTTFKTILDCGSFLAAAQKLDYTRSTITFQVQQLEQELHVQLFERIGRRMVLTKAGQALVPYVDAVLQAMEALEGQGRDEAALTGTLRVAVAETLLTYRMPPVLKAFRTRAPGVRLSVQCQDCYRIRDELIQGRVDLGIHYDVGGYGTSLITEPLAEVPLAVVGAPQLGDCELRTPGGRRALSLLTNDEDSIYQKLFERYLDERSIVLTGGVMDLGNVETVKSCVASNVGIALLPRFAVEEALACGALRTVETDLDASLTAVCSYHRNKWIGPAMALFLRLTREMLQMGAG